jgi:hypothetical protein
LFLLRPFFQILAPLATLTENGAISQITVLLGGQLAIVSRLTQRAPFPTSKPELPGEPLPAPASAIEPETLPVDDQQTCLINFVASFHHKFLGDSGLPEQRAGLITCSQIAASVSHVAFAPSSLLTSLQETFVYDRCLPHLLL